MRHLLIFLILGFIGGGTWQKGTVDKNGDIVIVELQNRIDCRNRNQKEIITVDSDWSILVVYPNETEAAFYIFDNNLNRIFKTKLLNEFVRELNNIPKNSFVRKIDKCTVPYDYALPDDYKVKIEAALATNSCTFEAKIMYCYCCADSIVHKY